MDLLVNYYEKAQNGCNEPVVKNLSAPTSLKAETVIKIDTHLLWM